jgi:hypothetical protein
MADQIKETLAPLLLGIDFSETSTKISHLGDFKHGLAPIYHFACYG